MRLTIIRNYVGFSRQGLRFVSKKKMMMMKMKKQTIQKQSPCIQVLRRIELEVDRCCYSCYCSEIAYWLNLKSCDCNLYFRSGYSHGDAKSGKKLHLHLQTEHALSGTPGSQARVQTEHLPTHLLPMATMMMMMMMPPHKAETMKCWQMKSPAIRNKIEMTASWTCSLSRRAHQIEVVFGSTS